MNVRDTDGGTLPPRSSIATILYGLAATRARLGSIDLALESLQRALAIQPNLRVRAQHDHDLNPLRNDPDFDRLIFSNPS